MDSRFFSVGDYRFALAAACRLPNLIFLASKRLRPPFARARAHREPEPISVIPGSRNAIWPASFILG